MIGLQLYWGSLESDIVESKIATAILDLPWQTEFCVYKYIFRWTLNIKVYTIGSPVDWIGLRKIINLRNITWMQNWTWTSCHWVDLIWISHQESGVTIGKALVRQDWGPPLQMWVNNPNMHQGLGKTFQSCRTGNNCSSGQWVRGTGKVRISLVSP